MPTLPAELSEEPEPTRWKQSVHEEEPNEEEELLPKEEPIRKEETLQKQGQIQKEEINRKDEPIQGEDLIREKGPNGEAEPTKQEPLLTSSFWIYVYGRGRTLSGLKSIKQKEIKGKLFEFRHGPGRRLGH